MKVVICEKYGKPDVLQFRDYPVPKVKKNELLIKIEATSVTTSDCYIRGFNVPLLLKPLMGLAIGFFRPRMKILGMIYSGVIVEKDINISTYNIGDRVYGFDRFKFGSYAEYKKINRNDVFTLAPTNLNNIDSTAIPYGASLAYHYLKKADIKNRKQVLIIGASGSVGSSAIQIARYYNSEVVGICSSANIAMVKELGAKKAIDYNQAGYLSMHDKFDLIFNCVPSAGRNKDEKLQKYEHLLFKDGIYIDVSKGTPSVAVQDLYEITKMVESNALKPVIDKVYNLSEIVDAHRYVEKWHKKGNVMIKVGET